ncbi:CBS domain-containing protein [Ferruginibacter lapsinanis]|uniref:CBS domain-containing protein n=1 Tax=Ferruginibacter lapsinanis TaxID=563172 RepID=UPI001E5ECBA9|nr:CBS domain-containing protein [Ferruginibacter lapsinanis]UEG49360.1 CBS domain-containing protein [Ferruginibacter lapsinanis]
MNKKVSDVLSRKGINLIAVTPDTSVFDALTIMAEKNIGAVVVLSGDEYVGIMTERDYARKIVLNRKSSSDTKVTEILSDDLPKVSPADKVDYCMSLMSDRNIRYLPVFENNKAIGILSINDLVKETILSQEETISHLTNYLHAGQ